MQSTLFNMDEVVSRKDYLKNKEKEKKQRQNKNKKDNKKKPPYFLIGFIAILGGYVIFQFNIYQKKYKLVNNVPVEISSLKDYDIYYTTNTYTYDQQIVLSHTKSNSSSKESIPSATGITNIAGENGYVYGIKGDALVRVKNNSNIRSNKKVSPFDKLEVVIDKGVKAYSVYKNEIYAFLQGADIETGVYTKNMESGKVTKVIDGEISQILVDQNNIFLVGTGDNKNIQKYLKDGSNLKQITENKAVKYMIEDDNTIYFTDEKTDEKIYSVNKSSEVLVNITKEGAVKINTNINNFNGDFCMGTYDGYIYYINSNKDDKLFKAKVDGSEIEQEVIGSSIEKISMIGYSVIYKEKNVSSIYRYEIKNGLSSELTSGRIIDFSASPGVK